MFGHTKLPVQQPGPAIRGFKDKYPETTRNAILTQLFINYRECFNLLFNKLEANIDYSHLERKVIELCSKY